MSMSMAMLMKPYLSFAGWILLTPYTQCQVLSSYPYFSAPPTWSSWIWDLSDAWTNPWASAHCKIQSEIVIPTIGSYRIYTAVDNIMNIYLDWVFLLTHAWFGSIATFDVVLPVWTHRILADCFNVGTQAWFCIAIRKISDNSLLVWSDSTWSYTTNTWF